ncbi:DUF2797 domain-containing protein [Mechercharimyces sp. CAU 1602]|uniref:DUF2797 domain-containing protein n=1 Tax=Mechercharimyces sp. CAU 1602 TaxID=2973933 RepID=UPI0021633451|nr:DUF2797 domain-containing protein [Mechercharimyces sp. CAU 1602]MCS1351979.1 DUF2797 domain-containing protein [Mechercharimyces sp. CAU 1602]
MEYKGMLHALTHEATEPVTYYVPVGEEQVRLNQYIGKRIAIHFHGEIHCIECGRKIKKTYNSGYCYPCFRDLAKNDLCIVKPHLCHYDEGTCRDDSFGEHHCMQPHYVYLALSSEVKVGITRKGNGFRRWVDQGAVRALPLAEVPTRKRAGELEVYLSQFLSDKTNWRKMLKNEITERDLIEVYHEMAERVPEEFRSYLLEPEKVYQFHYPQLEVPAKITSLNLDKTATVEGTLIGIKGQYLMLDTGVLNIRKFSGYQVTIAGE